MLRIEQVIYSPAVSKTHPELQKGVKDLSYPQALGELTKTHYTIAISGTHGKSTTTSMIGLLLANAGLDPTIIVGTKLKELGDSNCRVGKSKYLVIEADEHFASFLNYWPKIIVLTTVEADHLDYYKNLGNIIKAFRKYITHLSEDGYLVANKDDKNIRKILNPKFEARNPKQIQNTKYKIQNYSLKQTEAMKLEKILQIPGEHNVSNALAALTVARILKIPDAISYKSLGKYKGSWRRFKIFDVKIENCKLKIVSDYGHHPTEIKVTVEAAKQKWPKKKIWLIFQPHQYARTHFLWKDFVRVLSNLPIQKLIITDIYDVAGREDKIAKQKVSSEKLVKEILNTKYKIHDTLYISTLWETEIYLRKNLRGGEVVMIMGAGDIYNLTVRLTKNFQREKIES